MPYMVTFTINIPQTLAYIPYMDPVGTIVHYGLHIHDTIQQSFVALLGPSWDFNGDSMGFNGIQWDLWDLLGYIMVYPLVMTVT